MNIEAIAQQLDEASDKATSVAQISLTQPFDLKAAYEIQRLSIQRRLDRGERLVGYKMGFTSKAKMEQMGVHDLIWGRLTDAMFYDSHTDLPIAKFIHPRAEPEIAFMVSQDITEVLTLDKAKDYVSHVAVALEIIDSRYQNFKFSLEDVVADNCSSSAFALGEWMPVSHNVEGILMSMVFDDIVKGSGNSNAILDNPWASFVASSRLALENGVVMKKGDVVLAGAATSAAHIKAGQTISAHADGLGSVFLEVV